MKSRHPKPLNVHPSAKRQDQHDPGSRGLLQERNEMKKTTKPAVSASKPPARHPDLKTIEKPKKKLSDALARLEKATNAVNATFSAAEAYLEKLGLEVGASTVAFTRQFAPEHFGMAERDYPVDILEETYLEYRRVGDRFRITIFKGRSTIADEEISTSFTVLPYVPWDHVSQTEKRDAVTALPSLFEALARMVELEAELAEENSATAHAFVSRVS